MPTRPRAPEKGSNSAAVFGAFRPLSPPDARFPQNAWQFGALDRVPKYVWLSDAFKGVICRSFCGVPEKRLSS
jgi:hypothetical protein